jgi:hypothetical protein
LSAIGEYAVPSPCEIQSHLLRLGFSDINPNDLAGISLSTDYRVILPNLSILRYWVSLNFIPLEIAAPDPSSNL